MNNTIIIHNIRSAYNVGSILRSAECFGLKNVIFSGYSPYPKLNDDIRLPHVIEKQTNQIKKSSLGSEQMLNLQYFIEPPFSVLKSNGFTIIGLEQDISSVDIASFTSPDKWALLVGEELNGITPPLKKECHVIVEIAQKGQKESLNVSVATGIALFLLTT